MDMNISCCVVRVKRNFTERDNGSCKSVNIKTGFASLLFENSMVRFFFV